MDWHISGHFLYTPIFAFPSTQQQRPWWCPCSGPGRGMWHRAWCRTSGCGGPVTVCRPGCCVAVAGLRSQSRWTCCLLHCVWRVTWSSRTTCGYQYHPVSDGNNNRGRSLEKNKLVSLFLASLLHCYYISLQILPTLAQNVSTTIIIV